MATPASAGTTPPAVIEITDDMIRALADAIAPGEDPFAYPEETAVVRVGLQRIAPLIGAAYLRRYAETIDPTSDPADPSLWSKGAASGRNEVRRGLFARADKMVGEATR